MDELEQLRANVEARSARLWEAGFFRDNLAEETIRDLAKHALAEHSSDGQALCQAGDEADTVIVVVSGTVVIPGSEDTAFGPGAVLGTFGLLVGKGDATRTESLVAVGQVITLEVPYEHLAVHRSELIFEIGRQMHEALTTANRRVHELSAELSALRGNS